MASTTAAGPVAERNTKREDGSCEDASTGAYDLDHELASIGALCEGSVARVKVRTELRQEVERIKNPRAFRQERRWGDDIVSTEITANGTRL